MESLRAIKLAARADFANQQKAAEIDVSKATDRNINSDTLKIAVFAQIITYLAIMQYINLNHLLYGSNCRLDLHYGRMPLALVANSE